MRVCHISTVHPAFDIRIFHKECKSLVEAGYEVHLIAQGQESREQYQDGVNIHVLPKVNSRLKRITEIVSLAYKKALNIDAEIYHFHDPELIPVGLRLKKLGKRVIYDVHEDVPRDILTKPYMNLLMKLILSKGFEIYENYSARKFDALITATPYIRDRFLKFNKNTIDINNYPKLDELYKPVDWCQRENAICYIGGISRIRGIIDLVRALEHLDVTLYLAGNFENESLKREVMNLPGWKKVKYYGFVSRREIRNILGKVKVGVINFHPIPNHINAQPNKLFEYMSAGIPVVASKFPLWQNIVENNKCGVCVNPQDPKEIATAISYLLSNDNVAKELGRNARNAVETKFNWDKEKNKLLRVYENILCNR